MCSENEYIVTALNERGSRLTTATISAETAQAAERKFSAEWEVWEVNVKHENGGTTWVTVAAQTETKARELAFEQRLEYISTLAAEQYPREVQVSAEVAPHAE